MGGLQGLDEPPAAQRRWAPAPPQEHGFMEQRPGPQGPHAARVTGLESTPLYPVPQPGIVTSQWAERAGIGCCHGVAGVPGGLRGGRGRSHGGARGGAGPGALPSRWAPAWGRAGLARGEGQSPLPCTGQPGPGGESSPTSPARVHPGAAAPRQRLPHSSSLSVSC